MSYLFKENPKELKWWKWSQDENEEVIIPAQFTELTEFSFNNTSNIKKLYLHDKIKRIKEGTFRNFTNIETIEVHPENKIFYVEDGILFKKIKVNGNDVIQLELYPAEKKSDSYTIPDDVSCIGSCAFTNAKHLKKLTFSDNLIPNKEICFCGFSDSIEDVVVPSISVFSLVRKKTTIYPSKHVKRPKGYAKIFKKDGCIYKLSGNLSVITSSYRPLFDKVLLGWQDKNGGELCGFYETNHLPTKLLEGDKKFDAIIFPKFPLFWRDYQGNLKSKNIIPLTFPRVDFRKIEDVDTKFCLLLGYLAHPEFYNDDSYLTSGLYLPYVISQKHKILPYVYKIDRPDLLEFYSERNCINSKNFEKTFLNPAKEENAVKCIEYLQNFKANYLSSKPDGKEFSCQENELTYVITISTKANTPLHQKKLLKCNETVVGDVYLPFNVIDIEKNAFDGCDNITSVIAPKYYVEKFDYNFNNGSIIPLVFPMIDFRTAKNNIAKTNLLLGYIAHSEYYEDCVTGGFMENTLGEDYLENVIRQKKKLLPYIFELDRADMVEFYALHGSITPKNFDEDFLKHAKAANATKCIEFLENWKVENL